MYRIIPLNLGEYKIYPTAAYYKATPEEEDVGFVYSAFALEDTETGEIVMVDAGVVPENEYEQYRSVFHPSSLVPGAPSLRQVLVEKGIDPLKVKTVILTHLHMDHCYNVDLFANAKIYVQKKELQHAVTPTPVERSSYQVAALPGLPCWMKAWGRIEAIDGDREIMDGISVWLAPGHTPGSQLVFIETKEGPYVIVGDTYYNVAQFEKGRMNGNFTNLEEWYQIRDRLMDYCKRTGAHILCNHDPAAVNVEYYG